MRFPLIVHAVPASHRKGPKVLVRKGSWKVDSNHKDSQLQLLVDGIVRAVDSIVVVENQVVVQLEVVEPGREKELHVYLESM